jgi:rod shape-determining protein MreC
VYRRTGRGRLLLLGFLALSLVVITVDYRTGGDGPLENAKDISTTIVAPIQRGMTTVFRPVGDFFSSLGELSRLRSENEELRSALSEAEGDISEAEAIEEENEELREFRELDESWTTMDRVTASVIATSAANYRWSISIDKGSDDGIRPDMSVVAPEGLVGKIARVDDNYSIVLLLIDPQAGARGRIKGEEVAGLVRGNGADEPLALTHVDPESRVNEGDEVVTSGYDLGIFPPAIPIGEVVRAVGEGARPEQEIDVEPWVDFNALSFVEVLLETGPYLKDDADGGDREEGR